MSALHSKASPLNEGTSLQVVRPSRAAPTEAARVTRAEVNLAHARHNLRSIQSYLAREGKAPQVWAVLKADGYGHGARPLALALQQAGVDGVCVALLEEAIELREAGVRCPLLVMGGYYGRYRDGLEALVEHNITPVVYHRGQLEALTSVLQHQDPEGAKPFAVHLKVDTGMGRLGVSPEELPELLVAFRHSRRLLLDGLMTHLACADSDEPGISQQQLVHFGRATEQLGQAGLTPRFRHAANSAAMLRWANARFDIVRPGIAIFGVHPSPAQRRPDEPRLRPVMRVLSEIVALREVPSGAAIGYGHSWQAKRRSKIATLPLGYADGLNRDLSNRGHVLVCGKRAPIVGMVSMDLTMVDVTDIEGVGLRDEVVVLGEQSGRLGSDAIGADEIAAHCGTISWECLTSISRRVPRFYRQP